MSSRNVPLWPIAAVAAAVFCLSGCGGGGGSTPAPAAQPTDQSLSGIVIDGPIQGATVCLDLNKNGSCDAGEPTSAATDAQGGYTISGLTADQVNAGAPLIAVIPATALDSGVAVGTAYQLAAPAGKGAVISPVTHLVQTGVAQGMTRADAEAAVAAQLQVSAGSLYNDYTASSSADNTTLATVVPVIVSSLQAGEAPEIAAPSSAAAGYAVRLFKFTNASNYYLRYYYTSNVPDATGVYMYYDERMQLLNGSPLASSTLYDSALFATAQGWKPFNSTVANTRTAGSPNTSNWGNGYLYASINVTTDVSGQSIASVVAKAQDMTANTVATITGVDASQLSGTMPAGAKITKSASVNTATPVAYRVSDGYVATVTTLAALASAYPVPATPTPANTASMAALHGSAGCGTTVCTQERLRVAFGSNNAASYYLCDIDTSTGVQSNCTAIGTGTYSIGTALDGTTPIMTFAGLPASTSVQTFTRVFVERNSHIYYGWQDKLSDSTQTRLNKIAFEALAAAVGISAPTIGDAASAYAGNWSASYVGADSGNCATIVVDATGYLNGSCVSTSVGGSFIVSGHVTSTGEVSFTASGSTSSGATFSGSFGSTTGSGSWDWPTHGSGTWTATKP